MSNCGSNSQPPTDLMLSSVKPSVVMPSSSWAHVLSPAVVRRLAKRLDSLLRAEHGDDVAGRFIALEQLWLHDEVMRLVAFSPRLAGPAAELLGEPVNHLPRERGFGCEGHVVGNPGGPAPARVADPGHRQVQLAVDLRVPASARVNCNTGTKPTLPPSARSCRAPHEGPGMFGARVVDGQAGALSRDRPGRAAAA